MNKTLKYWGLFFASVFLISQVASADTLPNRQRRLAIYNTSLTPTGSMLLSQFANEDETYDNFRWGDPGTHRFYRIDNQLNITMNHNLMGGAPEYISWIYAMALSERMAVKITLDNGYRLNEDFVDVSLYAFKKAHSHWDQLGAPNDADSTRSSNAQHRQFAERLHGYVGEYHRLYLRSSQRFSAAITHRHESLGFGRLTLEDYIAEETQPNKRAAAEALLNYLSPSR
ncbi:MAG: hypothetical protein CL677_03745 [Bdellovibrionaceae bacterium]|nr:hypothetical protein [Pseudobdellovibrionaceae bacterium]|tara:strand:+ start:2884 stop:3567 length:684 start_codon:yes stop_codon:yes gene_type:complete